MKEIFGTSSVVEEARSDARRRAGEGKKPGKNFIVIILISLAIYLIAQLVMSLAMSGYMVLDLMRKTDVSQDFTFEFSSENLMTSDMVIVMLYAEIFMIIAFIFSAKVFEKRRITTLGFVRKNAVPSYIIGIAGGAAYMLIDALICKLTGAMTFTRSDLSAVKLVLFAFGWMIQGLAEEVMCRGFLLTSIARRYSVTLAVIANSVVFALLHVFNPTGVSALALFNLFLFGLFASLLFLKSGNIWICAGFHTAWNMAQGNVLGIPVSGINVDSVFASAADSGMTVVNGGDFGLEGGIGVTVLLLIGCAVLMLLRRRDPSAKI